MREELKEDIFNFITNNEYGGHVNVHDIFKCMFDVSGDSFEWRESWELLEGVLQELCEEGLIVFVYSNGVKTKLGEL